MSKRNRISSEEVIENILKFVEDDSDDEDGDDLVDLLGEEVDFEMTVDEVEGKKSFIIFSVCRGCYI